ncbi:MAG: DUF99 family protein [Methanosarcinales archaeon]|nr:MAG: DUF99 family protein [Methanosarcinales archaeon]
MLAVHIKPEIRILAIDDSALIADHIMIVGVVFRAGEWLDGVLRSELVRDGLDGTDVIIEMVTGTRHYRQIRVIMLDGVTYGGFNVIDIRELHRRTGLPVIVVMRVAPDMGRIRDALRNLPDFDVRWAGISVDDAAKIVQISTTHSHIPEPLRVAHLIATGIVCGESRGQA